MIAIETRESVVKNASYEDAVRLLAEGQREAGRTALEQLAAAGSREWEVYNDLAALYHDAGDDRAAIAMLHKAVAQEGAAGTSARNLATLLALTGDFAGALAVLGGILRVRPDDADVLNATREILAGTTSLAPETWTALVADLRAQAGPAGPAELDHLRHENMALRVALDKAGRQLSGRAQPMVHVFEKDETGLPVPPPKLRARVHGDRKLETFNHVGQTVLGNIESALVETDLDTASALRVLDFGCGSGRIARWLHGAHPTWRYHGTDIDAEAIGWDQKNLSAIGQFFVNGEMPPLVHADGAFDFVYSISIFTHLPEDMHLAWLEELRRVTRPGGWLLLTVHGEALFKNLFAAHPAALADFAARGFYYHLGSKTEGLPDFYRTAFHTNAYIRDVWSRYFRIHRHVEKGIANHQDLVLCQRVD